MFRWETGTGDEGNEVDEGEEEGSMPGPGLLSGLVVEELDRFRLAGPSLARDIPAGDDCCTRRTRWTRSISASTCTQPESAAKTLLLHSVREAPVEMLLDRLGIAGVTWKDSNCDVTARS
jgi:hypothetical protein